MTSKKQSKVVASEEFSLEEEALIRQWLEYRKVVLNRLGNPSAVPNHVCRELNDELMTRTYLAGNKYSQADFEVFSGLAEFYALQSIQTKEKYPHLSRWFCQVQHLNKTKFPTTCLFSRSLLY